LVPIVTIDSGSPADRFFVGGATYTVVLPPQPLDLPPVNDDATIRHGSSFTYNIPTGNGKFKVELKFLEVFPTYVEGSRKFHVDINGTRVLENYDILKDTLIYGSAIVKSFDVESKNLEGIKIKFTGAVRSAVVSTITITEVEPTGLQKRILDELACMYITIYQTLDAQIKELQKQVDSMKFDIQVFTEYGGSYIN